MSYLKSASSNLLTHKVSSKNQNPLNLGPKVHYLGIFGLQFCKNYYRIFNQHPRICDTIKLYPKWKKKYTLGPKILYLCLQPGMLKNYCHICNQCPLICLMAKFHVKIKILKSGTKNALFGCFGQQFWKTIVIFGNSALEFVLLQKLVQKIRILKFGTNNVRFVIFGAEIWIYYYHIWTQHPRICLVAKIGANKNP